MLASVRRGVLTHSRFLGDWRYLEGKNLSLSQTRLDCWTLIHFHPTKLSSPALMKLHFVVQFEYPIMVTQCRSCVG